MKKGMVQSQAIMYVFAMIVVAAILVFGVKSIGSFKKQGDSMQLIKFKETIVNSISEISSEYNSVEPVSVLSGGDFSEVCFYGGTSSALSSEATAKLSEAGFELVKDSIDSGAKENAFIMSGTGQKKILVDSFYAGTIVIDGGFFCSEKNKANKFDFIITGLGNAAKLEP
jgi:hypothetical protein